MLRFSLRQLTYFVSAAENASISKASRLLNVSQPSISAAISHLEREVGTALFIRRHGQGLSPTPEGRRFLTEAREVLARATRLVSDRRESGGQLQGALDLGFFTTFGPFFLPGLLTSFQREYPGVEIRFHEGDADGLYGGITSGSLDLAISYDFGFGPGVVKDLLLEWPAYILLPPNHRLARKRVVSLRELKDEPVVMHDLPHSRAYLASVFQAVGIEPRVRHRTSSFELVRGLVGIGQGISVLVARPASDRAYDGSSIVCRPIAESVPGLRVILVRRAQASPSRVQRALTDHTRDFFAASRFPASIMQPLRPPKGPAPQARDARIAPVLARAAKGE